MAVQLGANRNIGLGFRVSDLPDRPAVDPAAFIAARIAGRYAHPSRTAWLYLFHLTIDANFQAMPPLIDQVITAWFDEGDGLQIADPVQVIALCDATIRILRAGENRGTPATRDERRRAMSRQVMFSIKPPNPSGDQIALVDLFSRAIAFTPKSNRRVTETWRAFEGGWFSAYKAPE